MELLIFKLKSGIKIKPSHKGLFTAYCHGKVTDECIRKAKASGNPTLVKRATFALNARRWKHKSGGQIQKALLGAVLDYLSHPVQHLSSSIEGIWPTKKDYKNTIYINKNKLRLHYYDKKGNLVINSPVSTGAIAGAKLKSGDLKTPEGKFTISYSTDTADKHKFGDTLFYGLSYGRGIGIHGDAGSPNKLGRRASHGCIRMPNGELRCLQKLIGTGVGVPVIIEKTGGKITDARIKRSKVSSNPTLIKRTTFA